jgi:F-type H+-transporting ATPase subunit gamma
MASLKEIRQRRKTIASIHRMTSALKMVSQAKFHKAHGALKDSEVICAQLKDIAGRLMARFTEEGLTPQSVYLRQNDVQSPPLLILLSSDSGMCGAFNQRLMKEIEVLIDKNPLTEVICLGKVGATLLKRFPKIKILEIFTYVKENFFPILDLILSLFQNQKISGCSIIYNKFYNILKQEPVIVPLLPFDITDNPEGDLVNDCLFSYENPLEETLDSVLSLLFSASFAAIFKEHLLSENSSRVTAMDAASENAKTMLDDLQQTYNRTRQALITKELVEIISGSEAL